MWRGILTLIGGWLVLSCGLAGAETHVHGYVSGSWSEAGSPYLVEGDLIVHEDSSLFIKPGVWVIFQGSYNFQIDGLIVAFGIEEDSIYFTTAPGVRWEGFKFFWNPDTSRFYYCLFEKADNWPDDYGGVFYLIGSNIIVEHCTFQHNKANRGAAMYHYLEWASFRYNVCYDNHVYHSGGAINFGSDPGTIVERCVFYDNTAAANPGGALYFWGDNTLVRNCTVVQNSSPAVLLINDSQTEFVNCIFWYNTMGEAYQATYCDVFEGWPGIGNICTDPMFVNPSANNFHLLPESPCIDAGDPMSPPDPDNTIADLGAYYWCEPGPGGDLTLELTPYNPPIIIPTQGDTFEFNALAYYDGPNYVVFDAWVTLEYPNGYVTDPLNAIQNIYLAYGDSISRDCQWYVSASMMPGTYIFRGYLGDLPNTIMATDSFLFVKEAELGPLAASNPSIGETPTELTLSHAPEPFNPETVFLFNLPYTGSVTLSVFDVSGRLVDQLVEGYREKGLQTVTWNAGGLPSGMYLALLTTPGGNVTEKCLLVK